MTAHRDAAGRRFTVVCQDDGDSGYFHKVLLDADHTEVRQILARSDAWYLGRRFFEEAWALCCWGRPPVTVHAEHRASGLTYLLACHPDAHFMAIAPLCRESEMVLWRIRNPVTWANAGKWKILRRMYPPVPHRAAREYATPHTLLFHHTDDVQRT